MTRAPNSPNKPRVGITIGDPAGIGPEIVLKSVAAPEVRAICRPIIIADEKELQRQALKLGLACNYPIVTEAELNETELNETELNETDAGEVIICDIGTSGSTIEWGQLSAAAGQTAIACIETGARLALEGSLAAIATAPINKEALKLARSPFPGHTEMLTSLCGASESLMSFFAGELRVILLTIHMSLSDAVKAITKERVLRALVLADRELKRFGVARPRIAVAGLNPHAGEHGLFGSEEGREIEPAIIECRDRHSIAVSGPFPADTLFVRAARGEFDAVVACYHDQGLIAVKCMAFGEAVNVTLGLPIIRTSVDHGTAFDIAGRGVADAGSMTEAIKLAARLALKTVTSEP